MVNPTGEDDITPEEDAQLEALQKRAETFIQAVRNAYVVANGDLALGDSTVVMGCILSDLFARWCHTIQDGNERGEVSMPPADFLEDTLAATQVMGRAYNVEMPKIIVIRKGIEQE